MSWELAIIDWKMEEHVPLEVFDFNLDIDFETAYAMISNEQEVAKVHSEKDLRHNKGEHILNAEEHKFLAEEQIDPMHVAHEHDVFGHDVIADMHGMSQPGLLSAFESHAIESFLDSLISPGGKSEKPALEHLPELHFGAIEGATEAHEEQQVPPNTAKRPPKLAAAESTDTLAEYSGISGEYKPESLSFPEIAISDSEVPAELAKEPAKLKKWKHVALEKKRRDVIKDGFDNLIALIRYPRLEQDQIMSLKAGGSEENIASANKRIKVHKTTSKRIPKHVLLNYIIEDIEYLVLANKELENMIKALDENG